MTSAWGDLSFVILSHDSGTKRYLGVILHVHFYTPRWNLEGFCQAVTLKMAKCSPLTRSQPCLSPSHSKHSPTPLTPSQSERPSLNTRVDEAWLIEARKSWTAAQPLQVVLFFCESLSDENEKKTKNKFGWIPSVCFHSPECMELSQETTHLLWRQAFHQNFPKSLIWVKRKFLLHCGWWKRRVNDGCCLVFASIRQHLVSTLYFFSTSAIFSPWSELGQTFWRISCLSSVLAPAGWSSFFLAFFFVVVKLN